MRKETDDIESPKRSIRDSGYIDCWDSERSDSLSPPRHGRDDSFDSLDSFGSRSQQTPSPDVVLRGSSDGRGSDSESDLPHRKLPDVKKDDMSARRTSHGEPKSAVPFNQYLPNKSNQTAYVPAPLRRKKAEREEYRKSWSTATSPLGGERTFSYPETIEEEAQNEVGAHGEEAQVAPSDPGGKPSDTGLDLHEQNGKEQSLPESTKEIVAQKAAQKDLEEMRKRRRLEQAGIKIMPAAQRFASQKQVSEEKETVPDIILRKENPFLKCQSGHESEPEDGVERRLPDLEKDDFAARRARMNQPKAAVPLNQLLFGSYIKKENDGVQQSLKGSSQKKSQGSLRYGPRTAVSDDAESMSMLDMRCEEETAVQPHSKARQEQLQLINSQLKEEDDKWQDDLARWKSRRRSASQDLIKKEAERKKMERLLAGGDGTSERRKSIKTYREIVQEKERRERELHEAYKNARSREEAEGILQQYIERFTISEAVLERLEMPKILERSHSTEPNSSSPKDPNPMKYLRQQSLPPPKFTATVETTIARPSELDPSVSAGSTSPSKTVVPKAVPMLTPKPYHQPKNTQQVLKTFKVDEKVSVNGETFNGVEEEKERECTRATLSPSLTRSQRFEGVARVDSSPVEVKQEAGSIEISIKKANSLSKELTTSTIEEAELPSQKDETDCGQEASRNAECDSSECQHFTTTVTRASPTVAFVEFNPSQQPKDHEVEDKDQRKLESEMSGKVELVLSQKATKPKSPEPKAVLLFPYLNQVPETNQSTLPNLDSQVESNSSEKSPASTPRFNLWAWDPEEERRRQEKWQLEQERLLQERYQKEQDKLKEEWEKAQKEVEEEERRYYEEERKIIEDTVVPFTISSNSADQISTSSSVTEGNGPVNKMELEDSKEEEKRQRPVWEEGNDSLLKNKSDNLEETKSTVPPVTPAHPENSVPKGIHQDHQLSTVEPGTPDRRLNLELSQDTSWNQPWSPTLSHALEDVKQKTLPVDQSINHQVASPSERRKASPRENFRAGQLSPCSPTPPGQSPNRSISGKKLCSACGLPLGKGAAMIIETLSLYFHIQCFRCGICKEQLGDSVSGTDVRIRNGLLNCNECYMRSRSAGQPTTL
ncbi:LIM and calponin homology domains-containing protein 1 isoform X1 [Notamacropus eugenii]|uniref:LIM and calponin homology domains-containing protein 1 isoform X1 n=1 Tax=Notamacropus eugenii TaxID=9315 RepID=UPI003B67B331